MNIIKISVMKSPTKMREEVAKMAIEKNCTADEIWIMINGFRKTQTQGQRPRIATGVKDILGSIMDGIKITEVVALADENSAPDSSRRKLFEAMRPVVFRSLSLKLTVAFTPVSSITSWFPS